PPGGYRSEWIGAARGRAPGRPVIHAAPTRARRPRAPAIRGVCAVDRVPRPRRPDRAATTRATGRRHAVAGAGHLGDPRRAGRRPRHRPQQAQCAHGARTVARHLLILVPVSGPGPDGLPPEALVRTIVAARDRMPPATIVAVPLLPRGDEMRDALLRARVAGAYGVTHVLSTGDTLSGGGPRVLVPRELAYDNRDGQWRWRDDIPPRNR